MTTTQEYIAGGYTPYSVQNNIQDPDLAGLLDYLEREMGENEMYVADDRFNWYIRFGRSNIEMITIKKSHRFPMIFTGNDGTDISMPTGMFYKTYRYILPIFRNQYGK